VRSSSQLNAGTTREAAIESHSPGSRSSFFIIAVAVFALGFVGVALWFLLSRSPQVAVDANSSSGVEGASSQTNRNTINATVPRSNNTPANADGDASKEPPADSRAELRTALVDWLSATNNRDINKQMSFYAPTLIAFYQKRNATQAAVRAEKARLSSQANGIDVRAGEPEIQLDADGQTAIMRFRKSWTFSGDRPESGEVIQELRWRKIDSGWKIVSERDVEVIRIDR
jgi:ketosteroid isomerase-like protein